MKNLFRISIVLIVLLLIIFNFKSDNSSSTVIVVEANDPVFEYGICLDSFIVHRGVVNSGQTLGEIFYLHHIDHPVINKIVQKSKNIFDFRKAAPDNKYTVLCSKDSNEIAQYLIYEESVSSYIVFDITKNIDVIKNVKKYKINKKYQFLDGVFLNVLEKYPEKMPNIFFNMFMNSSNTAIKFLSNKSNIFEDINIISKMPKIIFMKALFC